MNEARRPRAATIAFVGAGLAVGFLVTAAFRSCHS